MNTILTFLTILAWVFGVLAIGLIASRIYANYSYTELAKALDKARGINKTFPILRPGFVFIICLAWILSS